MMKDLKTKTSVGDAYSRNYCTDNPLFESVGHSEVARY